MKKDVMIVTGAGQIGMAIARRTGFGKKIVLGDRSLKNAEAIAKIMNEAGYDVEAFQMDLSDRESILSLIGKALEYGPVKYLVNAAGVSPSQAPVETILKVDLYGTAVLLEEVGKVIAEGGAGVTISSQSGWRMPQLTPEEDRQLAATPTEELLALELLQPENIRRRTPLFQGQFFIPEGIRHIDDRTHPDFPDGIDDGPVIKTVTHLNALCMGEGK